MKSSKDFGLFGFDNSMSAWELLEEYKRDTRITLPHMDLGLPYPDGSIPLGGSSAYANTQEHQDELNGFNGWSQQQTTNDIEVLDDDVAIISPRIFAEARKNCRKNHSKIIYELNNLLGETASDSVPGSNEACEQPDLDLELHLSVGTSNNNKAKTSAPAPVPAPEAQTFSCPICMAPLSEPTSTKCGHIFCKECIKRAIETQSKCPTCRKKLGKRGCFRIYLPAAN